jgi:hypothetical protein
MRETYAPSAGGQLPPWVIWEAGIHLAEVRSDAVNGHCQIDRAHLKSEKIGPLAPSGLGGG